MLTDEAIQEILQGPAGHLQEVADTLVDAANEAGGVDNITAVVVKVVE
jgi:serine/threonine protein phosphatase PrpC